MVQTPCVNNAITWARVFASTTIMVIPTKAVNRNASSVRIVQPTKPAFATNARILVQEYAAFKLSVLSSITFLPAPVSLVMLEIPSAFAIYRLSRTRNPV